MNAVLEAVERYLTFVGLSGCVPGATVAYYAGEADRDHVTRPYLAALATGSSVERDSGDDCFLVRVEFTAVASDQLTALTVAEFVRRMLREVGPESAFKLWGGYSLSGCEPLGEISLMASKEDLGAYVAVQTYTFKAYKRRRVF